MKQKDLALILIIVIVSGMLSFFISKWLFASPENTQVKAEVVDVISTEFVQPDKDYFGPQSTNPTRVIRIGDGTNTTPFNGQ